MRLQSAIFSLEDTMLDPAALPAYHARAGLDKVLSILKMESVWLYAVSALPRGEARAAVEESGLSDYLRGLLTETDAACAADSAAMFEKAMRRLQGTYRDTVVFVGRLAALKNAREAGFRTVAVRGCADEEEWNEMCALATETLERYEDFLA